MSEMDVLEQVEKQTGVTPEELLNAPQLPENAVHVWGYFNQLSSTRQCGMSVNPISYGEIQAFSQLRRIVLREWEIDGILVIDSAFLASIQSDTPKPKK